MLRWVNRVKASETERNKVLWPFSHSAEEATEEQKLNSVRNLPYFVTMAVKFVTIECWLWDSCGTLQEKVNFEQCVVCVCVSHACRCITSGHAMSLPLQGTLWKM